MVILDFYVIFLFLFYGYYCKFMFEMVVLVIRYLLCFFFYFRRIKNIIIDLMNYEKKFFLNIEFFYKVDKVGLSRIGDIRDLCC